MNLFRSTAAALALAMASFTLPAHAQTNAIGDQAYNVEAPGAFAIVGDLLIARPLLIGATVVGAAVFVVGLPFMAMGGGIGSAGKALVVEPGKEAFVRCLGCTSPGYNNHN